jgi:hypothetical protein
MRELVLGSSSGAFPKLVAGIASPTNPSKPAPNKSGPYHDFWINAHNGPKTEKADLLVTTYGIHPLPPPVATPTVHFGNLLWLIEASAKSPPSWGLRRCQSLDHRAPGALGGSGRDDDRDRPRTSPSHGCRHH